MQLRAAVNPINETLIVTPVDIARQRTAQFNPRPKRPVRRALRRLSVATLAFGIAVFGSAHGALDVFSVGARPTAGSTALMQSPPVIWAIDKDGDGATDYYNPTHGAVRGDDLFGSGEFGASRDAGKRRHEGVDYIVAPGAAVRSPISGEVARLGYAYRGAGGFRVLEIVNSDTKVKARVLYVEPSVAVGDTVTAGQEIGTAQDLNARYPGSNNHVHVELRDAQQQMIEAPEELPSPRVTQVRRHVADWRAT